MRRGVIILIEMRGRFLDRPSRKFTERSECARAGPAMASSALRMDRQHRLLKTHKSLIIYLRILDSPPNRAGSHTHQWSTASHQRVLEAR